MKKTTCFLIITMLLSLLLPSCGEARKEAEMSAIREAALADGAITVVLDAGHGLGDVGALNEENLGEVTEAEINFAFTMLVKDGLESRGYTVILTHDGETKPDTAYDDGKPTYGPGERADFSNAQPARTAKPSVCATCTARTVIPCSTARPSPRCSSRSASSPMRATPRV